MELGTPNIAAANSGVYTPSAADNATPPTAPMELIAELEDGVNCGPTNLAITVTGTDSGGNPLTGTATFAVPAYSSFTDRVFPKGYAAQVVTANSTPFKTITSVSVVCDAMAAGLKNAAVRRPGAEHVPEPRLQDATELRPEGAAAARGAMRARPLGVHQGGRNPPRARST